MILSEQLYLMMQEVQELENLTNDERVAQAMDKLPKTLNTALESQTFLELSRIYNINRGTLYTNRDNIIIYNNQLYKRIS